MANFNRVLLMGNLTRDPEMRYTQSATAVVKFGMAVNRKYRGRDEQSHEETTFVDVEAWGRQAETINQYMSKGRPIFIEGRLRFDSWEGKDGQKRSKLLVLLENFQFMGGGDRGGRQDGQGRQESGQGREESSQGYQESGQGSQGGGQENANRVSDRMPNRAPQSSSGGGGGDEYDFDDIPF